jgi:lactate permease
MWIVVNGLLLYNIAVRSGRFDALRTWVIDICRTIGASYWS